MVNKWGDERMERRKNREKKAENRKRKAMLGRVLDKGVRQVITDQRKKDGSRSKRVSIWEAKGVEAVRRACVGRHKDALYLLLVPTLPSNIRILITEFVG